MRLEKIDRRVRLLGFIRRVLRLDSIVQFDMKYKAYLTVSEEFSKQPISDEFSKKELAHVLANGLVNAGLVNINKGQFISDFERGTETWTASINIVI